MVQFIAESLGHVVETDQAPLDGNAVFARVCICWPLERPLISMREFQFGHESTTFSFRYEKLRNHCFRCHSLQHDIDEFEVPEVEAALGHQDPEEDDNNGHDAMPTDLVNNFSEQTAIQASPTNTIAPSGHLLALPSTLREQLNLQTASVLMDGRQILVSDLRNFYHSYTAVADPSEAKARKRILLLALEHTGNTIIHEVIRPIGSDPYYSNKRRRTAASEASSSTSNSSGGAAGPVPPPYI